ncbi:hypothetical protein BN6_53010 [Saccharothrix espanaensis DSM 44229]|uniref:Uncharacterized protein n=1 Tax=Saccharothrix espanaensis (strain ATCC 51144 / DSM 44229 / JCM 9112 / NBRC 15066 / NRRL 15764) TaxID=1179773 RepID=K0JXG4_SACES|nr:hypothetical protein BN6_53010 [Saccharothrix espanaensis DSM 44229]
MNGPMDVDRWDEPAGDRFACRYEAYLTNPRSQRRKTHSASR